MLIHLYDCLCRAYSARAVRGEPCNHMAAWYGRRWALAVIAIEGHAGVLARTVAGRR